MKTGDGWSSGSCPCSNGDIVTIAGMYADGTKSKPEGPYDEKPLQRFQLRGPEGQGDITMFELVPIDDDGKIQAVLTKPAKGTRKREQRRRAARKVAHERGSKAKVRSRDDHRCQWPGCLVRTPEVAHVKSKGSGGSSETTNMLCMCGGHHRGPRSLHSGHLQVRPKNRQIGMDEKSNRIFASRERVTDPFVDL